MDFLILGFSFYCLGLITYTFLGVNANWEGGFEAAIKYFSISALTSAFIWLGIGCIYILTNTTNFIWISPFIIRFLWFYNS